MTTVEVPDIPIESTDSAAEDQVTTEQDEPKVNGHEIPHDEDPKHEPPTSENPENGRAESPDATAPPGFNEERRDSRIRDARNKFETQGSFERKSGNKRKEKVKYAGLASAKNRFMDAATADNKVQEKKKKPIRITPPRDGNMAGVVESEPAERDPNVIRSDTWVEDEIPAGPNTRNTLAKFREMEQGKSMNQSLHDSKVEVDPTVTKNLMSVWKTRESNPEPNVNRERKSQVKIREEGDGGVYENNPEVLTDVVREMDQSAEVLPEGVDTRALRDRFLTGSVNEDKATAKKLSALEEITQMTRLEQNVVYENIPSAPKEGIVRSAIEEDEADQIINTINTKELRTKFLERQAEKKEKQPIQLAEGEGGVYENEPVHPEGVVRAGDYVGVNIEEEVGRWAAEAKQRFLEDVSIVSDSLRKEKPPVQLELAEGGVFENEPSQRREDVVYGEEEDELLPQNTVKNSLQRLIEIKEAASKVVTSKTPVIVEKTDTSAGVYENVPETSQADATATDMMSLEQQTANANYASQAKQRFLEQQRQEEEARKRKSKPEMVDIWSDLCKDSGVFENKPIERDPTVIREHTPETEEDEEEEEESDIEDGEDEETRN